MHLIQTLVFAFIIAFGLGFLAQKLKLSPIIGYLLAGVIVGPYTPNGMNADLEIAEQCAEIGVILLMFGVGLHFHFNDLIAVRKTALPGAIIQIAGATGLGILAALLLGWPWTVGAAMGTAISVASTVVLTRILSDNRVLHTPGGLIALGWLIVEDLFTILAIVLLPVLMSPDGANLWQTIGFTFLKLTGLFLIVLFVGQKIIPWVLTQVARTGTRELFTLAVLAIALGITYLVEPDLVKGWLGIEQTQTIEPDVTDDDLTDDDETHVAIEPDTEIVGGSELTPASVITSDTEIVIVS